jgi:hypothetical protein
LLTKATRGWEPGLKPLEERTTPPSADWLKKFAVFAQVYESFGGRAAAVRTRGGGGGRPLVGVERLPIMVEFKTII